MGYYRYKGDNPESGKSFYEANKDTKLLLENKRIRATGIIVAPLSGLKIMTPNIHALSQMERRKIIQSQAQAFVDKADFALKQRNGTRYAYYSSQGFAVLDTDGTLATVGELDANGKILYDEVMKYVGKTDK